MLSNDLCLMMLSVKNKCFKEMLALGPSKSSKDKQRSIILRVSRIPIDFSQSEKIDHTPFRGRGILGSG